LLANTFQVSTVLSGGHYQMLSVDAPNVPPAELRTAVRWRLKDMLDFHVDDATIDVLDIPVDKTATVRQHAMFAIAARNTIIEQRQKQFALAKIQLLAIDIPEMAQRNISALLETEGRGLAMLSFDEDGGLLTVSFQGELYLSRRIDVTLVQLLDTEHERKHARFEKITLELQRSLDHFDRQFHFISVARLLLAPSPVTGLEEYLSSNLYTPVERFDLADAFDIKAVPGLAALDLQQQLFIALGAALRLEEKAL
jgi:MSHA biogenesis protein MshI